MPLSFARDLQCTSHRRSKQPLAPQTLPRDLRPQTPSKGRVQGRVWSSQSVRAPGAAAAAEGNAAKQVLGTEGVDKSGTASIDLNQFSFSGSSKEVLWPNAFDCVIS